MPLAHPINIFKLPQISNPIPRPISWIIGPHNIFPVVHKNPPVMAIPNSDVSVGNRPVLSKTGMLIIFIYVFVFVFAFVF